MAKATRSEEQPAVPQKPPGGHPQRAPVRHQSPVLATAGHALPSEFSFVCKGDVVSGETGCQWPLWNWEWREEHRGRAQEMLLILLACFLPAAFASGQSCLRCWPELPALMAYDLRVLWGPSEPPRELSWSLRSLLLQAPVLPAPGYLGEAHLGDQGQGWPCARPSAHPLTSLLARPVSGQEHLEREAAALFTHIDRAIGRFHAGEEAACPRAPSGRQCGPRPPQKTHWSWEGSVLRVGHSFYRVRPSGVHVGEAWVAAPVLGCVVDPSLVPPRQTCAPGRDARPEAAVC